MCNDNDIGSLGKQGRHPFIRTVRFVEVEVIAPDVNLDGAETWTGLISDTDLPPREPEGNRGASRTRYVQCALVCVRIGYAVPAVVDDEGMRVIVPAGHERHLGFGSGCDIPRA